MRKKASKSENDQGRQRKQGTILKYVVPSAQRKEKKLFPSVTGQVAWNGNTNRRSGLFFKKTRKKQNKNKKKQSNRRIA